ncbi:MAG TPA: GNAT family N-acetyltransferase [Chitinophagaceae bacterium]|nr:GNAT family N-acetyltransferase [Chitinophagaceae bacterium]
MEKVFREANPTDITGIQLVRNAVKENVLSDPALVSDQDCFDYLINRGKGWVCEIDDKIVAFAIADLVEENIWALFVHPDYEKKSIGKSLHDMMINWYFDQGKQKVWLSTGPHTRAESFYRKAGWKETGITGKGEIKFELTLQEWVKTNDKH